MNSSFEKKLIRIHAVSKKLFICEVIFWIFVFAQSIVNDAPLGIVFWCVFLFLFLSVVIRQVISSRIRIFRDGWILVYMFDVVVAVILTISTLPMVFLTFFYSG
jgi:hypothetical protein